MKITNIQEAEINLEELVEAVLRGEEVVISKSGNPVVQLIPYQPSAQPRKPGYWEGKIKMADDFDSLPDF